MTPEATRIVDAVRREDYEAALGVPSASPEAVSRAHLVLSHRLRGSRAAIEALNRAKGALSREGPLDRGRRLFRAGKVVDALPFLEAGVDERGAAEDFLMLGQGLCHAQRHEAALAPLHQAILQRGAADDHVWLAGALERCGRLDEAEAFYGRAIALRGGADDHLALGQLLLNRGRHREAAAALREAADGDPDGLASQLLDRCRAEKWRARLRAALRFVVSIALAVAALAKRGSLTR